MCLWRLAIVSVRGPRCASTSDIGMFRGGKADESKDMWDRSALYWQLLDGKKAIADSGYEGEPHKIVTSGKGQSRELEEFISRVKNRQETLHWRLKLFRALSDRFYHGRNGGTDDKMAYHKTVVEAGEKTMMSW